MSSFFKISIDPVTSDVVSKPVDKSSLSLFILRIDSFILNFIFEIFVSFKTKLSSLALADENFTKFLKSE